MEHEIDHQSTMAEQVQPRVHPVDVESGQSTTTKPTAPLMPPRSAYSDPRPATAAPLVPPPKRKRRRSCLCRCICWSISVLLILIVLIGITAGILYLVYRPKIPDYSVERLTVKTFDVNSTSDTASAAFDVTIRTYNPNKKIGIYYVDGSDLSAWYGDVMLCEGELPVFYQGHRDETNLNVEMAGEKQVSDGVVKDLDAVRNSGSVPLKIKGTVPVRVKFGGLKLRKMKFKVRCDIVVDSLSTGADVTIKSRSCSFKFELGIFGITF